MKTIGLIGGLSWQSSSEYYRIINEEVNKRLGKNHSAKILMYSFDFEGIEQLQVQGEWTVLDRQMSLAAASLEEAGAGLMVICSNTMHRCAKTVRASINVPLIHIADSTGAWLSSRKIRHAGLIGTRFLMQDDMYPALLNTQYEIKTTLPSPEQMETVHHIIYTELVKGRIREESKQSFLRIIGDMSQKGIEVIILGCTEIPLLVKQNDCNIPVIDTTCVHAMDAVNESLLP